MRNANMHSWACSGALKSILSLAQMCILMLWKGSFRGHHWCGEENYSSAPPLPCSSSQFSQLRYEIVRDQKKEAKPLFWDGRAWFQWPGTICCRAGRNWAPPIIAVGAVIRMRLCTVCTVVQTVMCWSCPPSIIARSSLPTWAESLDKSI